MWFLHKQKSYFSEIFQNQTHIACLKNKPTLNRLFLVSPNVLIGQRNPGFNELPK